MNRTAALASLAALSAVACQSCHEDHPYVPYAIGDVEPRPVSSSDGQAIVLEEGGATALAPQPSEVAPVGAKAWNLGGLALAAPEGEVFQLGFVRDLDGDGAVDAVTIMRGTGPAAQPRVFYFAGLPGGGAKAGVVVGQVPTLAGDPACTPVQRLLGVGRHSVYVELGVDCAVHGDVQPAKGPPSPTRWAAVVGVAPFGRSGGSRSSEQGASVRLSWLVTDPPGAPVLSLDVDASDYDGDGLDDVALRVTLDGGSMPFESGPRASALLRWIDRPAGMSREPDQPEASFQTLAAAAASRAGKAKEAVAVPALVHRVRALYDAICAEGGLPRVTRAAEGRAIECGATSRALEESGLAEARALVTTGDVLGAIAALDRAEEPPAAHTASRVTEAQGLVTQAAPVTLATSLRVVNAVPLLDHGRAPYWGALSFESNGKLLVRTLGPVVRVDPAQGEEAEALDVPAWKAAVVSPDGSLRWGSVRDPCDGSELRASFSSQGEGEGKQVVLPITGRAGTRCGHGSADVAVAVPVSWGQDGLLALVAGEPIAFAVDLSRATVAPTRAAATAPPVGAPRSPDGKTVVVPTSLGIVVKGERTRLYRAKEIDDAYAELRDCAVSDDASRVACTRGGRAFVGTW